MTDIDTEQQAPDVEAPSTKVWGHVRLNCECWWSWKADNEADYIFPRDRFYCKNENVDGVEHGDKIVISVRMFSHSYNVERAQLDAAHRQSKAAKKSTSEAVQAREELNAAHEEALQVELLAIVDALAAGEKPKTTRGQRRRLREVGVRI